MSSIPLLFESSPSQSPADLWVRDAASLWESSQLERQFQLHLAHGGHINSRDASGLTALLSAASRGNVSGLEWLLHAGADPHLLNPDGQDALLVAASFGHWSCCSTLASFGARLDSRDAQGRSIWLAAAQRFGWAGLQALSSALGVPASIHDVDASGHNGLMLHALSGRATDAPQWVSAGLDPLARNRLGWTALMCLCVSTLKSPPLDLAASIEALVASGCRASMPSRQGQHPFALLHLSGATKDFPSLPALLRRISERDELLATSLQERPGATSSSATPRRAL